MASLDGNILVVDPDRAIQESLSALLAGQGFRVIQGGSAEDGLAKAAAWPPSLILLELELPDMDGVALCQQIRQWSTLPIIVLSTRRSEADIVQALDSGADDYLIKPFYPQELLARIRVALRRVGGLAGKSRFVFGSLELDVEMHSVTQNGVHVHLTATEYRLLKYLIQHTGQLLTYSMILSEIWGKEHAHDVQYLRVYINQLRTKIEPDPGRPCYILNVPLVGYRFASGD